MGMLKDENKKPMPTGYQQGVLLALGSQHGDRFGVRCIDRWYPDHVQPIFGTKVYSIADQHKPGRKQYIVKSVSVSAPHIDDVVDWRGFCRAWLEIHGGIKPVTRRRKTTREIYHVPGFRIYGNEHILQAIMHHLPIQPRKILEIKATTKKSTREKHIASASNPPMTYLLRWNILMVCPKMNELGTNGQ